MEELVRKEVDFNGATLVGVKKDDKVYVGVSWVCKGLINQKSFKDNQIQKIKKDDTLSRGCLDFQAGVFDEYNSMLAIELDYLPLWLAKIVITTKMKEDYPKLAENLFDYQMKAKDVLAKAFLNQKLDIPQTYA